MPLRFRNRSSPRHPPSTPIFQAAPSNQLPLVTCNVHSMAGAEMNSAMGSRLPTATSPELCRVGRASSEDESATRGRPRDGSGEAGASRVRYAPLLSPQGRHYWHGAGSNAAAGTRVRGGPVVGRVAGVTAALRPGSGGQIVQGWVTTRPPAPGRLGVPPKLLWHQPRRRSSPCRAPDWNRVLCNCRGPCSALLAVGRRQPSAPCRPPTAGDSVERVPAMLRRVTDHAEGLELVALLRMLERLAGSSRAGPCPPEGAARCTPSGLSLALGGSLPPLPLALPALPFLVHLRVSGGTGASAPQPAARPAQRAGSLIHIQINSAVRPTRADAARHQMS